MPRAKRTPIDYPQQFGGIFRPRETVEDEIALLAEDPTGEATTPEAESASLVERTNERTRIRHSFDIWRDQLLGLTEIQTERFTRTGRKPKLGELVQEALDAYIAQERKRTNVRTNERS